MIDIDQLRQGDRETFRLFFTYFYPKLKAFACRFVDEDTAEDIVQDVFASYWEQKHKIEADNIQSYLFKCIQNKCLNHLKRRMMMEEYELQVRIAESRMIFLAQMTDANDVFTQVVNRDLRELVEKAINKLPPKCAQAFRLCYFHHLSHKEIAEAMGMSSRTIEGYTRQALHALRQDLKNSFFLISMFYSIF
ncbi:MAG: RNA polymerase sigma-70 factor [Tannerellaceae bacterium]|jgi:RNA polymerase sigma-70 factor (ECF subfamily)|nr:RNA polymerase sigma-70 factor [Tannerellaceae bacterium]